jgi:regulator of nonsense transcripts 3
MTLSEFVRQSSFEDAQNTSNNPCLIGPPNVEFAPYSRTPGGRRRVDARAGTIDQDSEFMAFLEGLANPTTNKEVSTDTVGDGVSGKQEKVTTTPLVQYLKDKKANKHKEAAVKAAKKQEAQLAKGKSSKESATSSEDAKRKGKETKADRVVERAAKEAVKILNREASAKGVESSTKKTEGSASTTPAHPKLDLGRVPSRQRGSVVAAHIRMLQRDLGLSPAQAHRQVRRDTADAQKAERAAATAKITVETKDAPAPSIQSPNVPTAPKAIATQSHNRRSRTKPSATTEDGKGSSSSVTPSTPVSTPIVLLKKPDATPTSPVFTTPAVKSTPVPNSARKGQSSAGPSDGATQAFIKHANPSQGVTEPLLKEAMEKFGAVSMVEIDKRKGFAYVDFVDAGSLRKAMAANPIAVAQGTVQVMQRKGTSLPPEKKPPHHQAHQAHQPQQSPHPSGRGGRGGRGGTIGRRGGRGGGGTRGGGGNAPQAPASAPTGPAVK